jgi:hypothetical protein
MPPESPLPSSSARAYVSLNNLYSRNILCWKIKSVHLDTEVRAPDLDESLLEQAAQTAAEQCPVSALFKPGLESLTHKAHLLTTA